MHIAQSCPSPLFPRHSSPHIFSGRVDDDFRIHATKRYESHSSIVVPSVIDSFEAVDEAVQRVAGYVDYFAYIWIFNPFWVIGNEEGPVCCEEG